MEILICKWWLQSGVIKKKIHPRDLQNEQMTLNWDKEKVVFLLKSDVNGIKLVILGKFIKRERLFKSLNLFSAPSLWSCVLTPAESNNCPHITHKLPSSLRLCSSCSFCLGCLFPKVFAFLLSSGQSSGRFSRVLLLNCSCESLREFGCCVPLPRKNKQISTYPR